MNVKEFSDPEPTNIFRYPRYLLRMTELELLDRERRATERRIRAAQ